MVAPDLLGHGQAGRGGAAPTLQDYAADVLRILDEADVESVDVVGVSLGAMVAVALTAAQPHRVGKVVLADCVAKYPPGMVTMWNERAEAVQSNGLSAFIDPTMSLWFTDGFLDNNPDLSFIKRVLESTDPQGYADACRVLASADVRSEAAAISKPTLVVCGSEDAQPFIEGAEWLAANVADARKVWIEGGRHACFFENAPQVSQELTSFLKL